MKENYVFIKPAHPCAYRRPDCDIPMITGVIHIDPEYGEGRICYELTYEDGFIDYVPISDVTDGSYKFVVM